MGPSKAQTSLSLHIFSTVRAFWFHSEDFTVSPVDRRYLTPSCDTISRMGENSLFGVVRLNVCFISLSFAVPGWHFCWYFFGNFPFQDGKENQHPFFKKRPSRGIQGLKTLKRQGRAGYPPRPRKRATHQARNLPLDGLGVHFQSIGWYFCGTIPCSPPSRPAS